MRPAVSFVASNKDATELLIMFNDFNCTVSYTDFLKIRCAWFTVYRYTIYIRRQRIKQAVESL